MKSFTNFLKYNNLVPITLGIIFLGAGGALAANDSTRQAIYSSTETVRTVDNSLMLAANFDNNDVGLRINSITEDEINYYIEYSYKTMIVSDFVWQNDLKKGNMIFSKKSMMDRDLGLYAAEQIGQVIDQNILYLKEVQSKEKKQGLTVKSSVIAYSGLVGKLFDRKEKVFPGYQPVIPPTVAEVYVPIIPPEATSTPKEEESLNTNNQNPPASAPTETSSIPAQSEKTNSVTTSYSQEMVRKMIEEAINAYMKDTPTSVTPAPTPVLVAPVPNEPAPETPPAPPPVIVPETTPAQPAEETSVPVESPAKITPPVIKNNTNVTPDSSKSITESAVVETRAVPAVTEITVPSPVINVVNPTPPPVTPIPNTPAPETSTQAVPVPAPAAT